MFVILDALRRWRINRDIKKIMNTHIFINESGKVVAIKKPKRITEWRITK